MNVLVLSGRLTKDPEIKFTKNGNPLAAFTLAVQRNKEETDFINCQVFGKGAETIGEYVGKGSMLGVVGQLQTNSWTDKNGQRRKDHHCVVSRFEFLDTKRPQKTEQDYSNGNTEFSGPDPWGQPPF